jgi:hypothetical protein
MNALIVDSSPARAALDKAEDDYTAAVRDAAHTGNWCHVAPAAAAVHQARAALTQEREA